MVQEKISKFDIMLKYNIGKSTVNSICKCKKRLKNFKTAKCEIGISKFVNATKSLESWNVFIVNWTVLFICGSDRILPTTFHRLLYAESTMCCGFVCFCSFILNLKNSVMRFFCLSVQISESIFPTSPDNRRSTL